MWGVNLNELWSASVELEVMWTNQSWTVKIHFGMWRWLQKFRNLASSTTGFFHFRTRFFGRRFTLWNRRNNKCTIICSFTEDRLTQLTPMLSLKNKTTSVQKNKSIYKMNKWFSSQFLRLQTTIQAKEIYKTVLFPWRLAWLKFEEAKQQKKIIRLLIQQNVYASILEVKINNSG